ncbi:hypothetical protein AB0H88_25660 [Nonomuraea sp. NPDC050680]|uniref:hypothetical protein n=1 Tax=Nonomuraea sp. NPDC050680 TaxID=3154630 RepID=UPI0033D52161
MTVTSATRGLVTDDALSAEVRALLRAGMPIRAPQCGPALLALPGVRARARAENRASRAQALDFRRLHRPRPLLHQRDR